MIFLLIFVIVPAFLALYVLQLSYYFYIEDLEEYITEMNGYIINGMTFDNNFTETARLLNNRPKLWLRK